MFEYFPGNYRWSYNTLMALAAGAQIGDIELIGVRLREKGGDDEAWHREWSWLAGILERRAEAHLADGTQESASEDLFLASLYHTMAERFMPPSDARRLQSYARALDSFERARTLSSYPIERVLVPYETATLPAYFLPSLSGRGRSPAVIFLCGLDTTKELSYLRVRQQLARRGLHCLAIDTPGVGEALRHQHLYTRHDYERPVAATVDYLETRADVDPAGIGIIGSSLGGYYVARAAAFEPRLGACVAWGAIFDYHAVWKRRLSAGGAMGIPTFQLMFITGADSLEQALERIEHFKVVEFAERIQCPFLLVHGSEDQQISLEDAHAAFQVIGSKRKELKIFSGEDGGTQHCQLDNPLPALHYIADWLVHMLKAPQT